MNAIRKPAEELVCPRCGDNKHLGLRESSFYEDYVRCDYCATFYKPVERETLLNNQRGEE